MVPFFKLAMYATSIKNLVHRTIFLSLLNLSRDILVCVNERTPIINEEYLIHYSNPKSSHTRRYWHLCDGGFAQLTYTVLVP